MSPAVSGLMSPLIGLSMFHVEHATSSMYLHDRCRLLHVPVRSHHDIRTPGLAQRRGPHGNLGGCRLAFERQEHPARTNEGKTPSPELPEVSDSTRRHDVELLSNLRSSSPTHRDVRQPQLRHHF